MKFFQALASALVGGFVLTLAAGAHAQSTTPTTPQYATVVRIQGEARYSPGNSVWHPLTIGQTLGAGNVIQTAANSKVDLVLGDKISSHINATTPAPPQMGGFGLPPALATTAHAAAEQNVIRMQADTVLAIDKLLTSNTGVGAVSDTELDLRQGTIFGNVKKLSAESQYLIKTPNGVAGIRGTTFIIGANGGVTVITGSLVISHVNSNGQTITAVLNAGDTFNPQSGLVVNTKTGVATNPLTGQTTQLTPAQVLQQLLPDVLPLVNADGTITFPQFTTISEGTITYANDQTTVYVSPTSGR
jgi:hypothetical protein